MAGYLEGVRTGSQIAQEGVSAYDRAKEWTERLKEKADAHTAAAAALKTEASRYADTQDEKAKKDKIEAERAASAEGHAKKQDELIDAEIQSIKGGKGRYGVGGSGRTVPADLSQANKNLDNARKAMAPYTSGGLQVPQDIQDQYHASLADVDRLSRGLGLSPATPTAKPTQTAHPAVGWLDRIKSATGFGSAPAVDQNDYNQFLPK